MKSQATREKGILSLIAYSIYEHRNECANVSNEVYMRMALEQAQMAFDLNEVPIGAILVLNEQVVGRGFNRREMWQDPTAHAEMIAIREAARVLGGWRLTGALLYVTLEPCAMCAGAILQSRIGNVYFGASEPKFGACGSIIDTFSYTWNHQVQVEGGILAEESAELLKCFFRKRRKI